MALVRPGEPDIEFSPIQQRLLARLVLAGPPAVHRDDLAEAVWGREQPASARQAIQNQVSRIRGAAGDAAIETVGDRYRLCLATDIDLLRDAVLDAETRLARGDPGYGDGDEPAGDAADTTPGDREEAQAVFEALDAALTMTGDDVLAGLDHDERIDRFREQAHTVLSAAAHLRLEAALVLKRWDWALIEAQRLTQADPLDERAAANYIRALTRAGRRGEALTALARVRKDLRLQLGIESGEFLDAAESEILHGRGGAANRARRRATPPLVGRQDELRRVLQAVAQRRPVRVRGEHGAGVSRMLFEVRARLVGLGVRAVLVRAEEHPHSATSLIEELLLELGASRDPAQNAISAFASVAAAIDAENPTVFLVDDVQFLGPSAWQALRAVAEADFGGLVLGGHGHVLQLDGEVEVLLEPLGADAIAEMVRHWGVADPAEVAKIYRACGGNPLAARLLTITQHSSAGPVSETPELSALADFLQQLVGELGVDRRHDLQLAAIAGDGYPVSAFDRLIWAHEVELPSELVEADAGGALRFRHGIVQGYVYRTLPRGVLLDMHYALGRAASDVDAPAGTIARHLLAAAELDPDGAIEAAREAAREAALLGAHADAARWLERALAVDLTGDPRRTITLSIDHADALRLSGDPGHLDALMSATRQALDHGDDELIAAAGFALLQLGGSSPAGELDGDLGALARRVIEAVSDPQLRAPVQAAASLAWSMTGHADTSKALFDEAESAATEVPARLRVLPFAYLAVGRPADLPRRAALADELVALADAAGEPVPAWEGAHLQFSVHLQRGDGIGAREALRRMESLISHVGDVGRRWSVLYCSATIAHIDGDLPLADSLAGQAYAMFAPVSAERAAAAYYSQLLPLRLDQGRLAELQPVVLTMVAAQPGVTAWHAAAALVLAAGIAGGGSAGSAATAHDAALAQARLHAGRALELAQDDFTWLAAHVVGGRAAAILGDADLVERYADRLRPWADLVCWQGTCSYGPVAAVLEMLARAAGDGAAAGEYAATAERLTRTLAG
jgi:DNA-binding SARP family transcriptional activator